MLRATMLLLATWAMSCSDMDIKDSLCAPDFSVITDQDLLTSTRWGPCSSVWWEPLRCIWHTAWWLFYWLRVHLGARDLVIPTGMWQVLKGPPRSN